VHTSKVFMRHVLSVEASLLFTLQRAWRFVHPMELSGREPPLDSAIGSISIPLVGESGNKAADEMAKKAVSSTSKSLLGIESAKERYLKRKNLSSDC
jgi:hypothetical protein